MEEKTTLACNEFEKILKELTDYILTERVTKFHDLVTYSFNNYGIIGLNIVSTKTTYFAELIRSFKEENV